MFSHRYLFLTLSAAGSLGLVAFGSSSASGAVIDFEGVDLGEASRVTYDAGVIDGTAGDTGDSATDDITLIGSDGTRWGVRSTQSGSNDRTVFMVDQGGEGNQVIRGGNWLNEVHFRPTVNADADAANDVTFTLESIDAMPTNATATDGELIGILAAGGTVRYGMDVPGVAALTTFTLPDTFQGLSGFYIEYDEEGGDRGNYFYLDNVTYSAIPEPASLALLGVGGLMLVCRRR